MSEVQSETLQDKADRWMRSIQPYLIAARQPNPDWTAINYARSKNPFLDWVMGGHDPMEFFRPIPEAVTPPPAVELNPEPGPDEEWIQTPFGRKIVKKNATPPEWFAYYGKLLEAIATKLGVE